MFATDGQHLIFLAFFAGGLACGLVYELLHFIKVLLRSAKVVSFVADFLFMLFAGFLLITVADKVSYGQIRLYSLLSYIFGYFLENFALHKHFAKLSLKVYNQFTVAMTALKQKDAVKKLLK